MLQVNNDFKKNAVTYTGMNRANSTNCTVANQQNPLFKGQLGADSFTKIQHSQAQSDAVSFTGILFNDEPKIFKTILQARNLAEDFLDGDKEALQELKAIPNLSEADYKTIQKYLITKLVDNMAKEPTNEKAECLVELDGVARVAMDYIFNFGLKTMLSINNRNILTSTIVKEYENNKAVLEYLVDKDKFPLKSENLKEIMEVAKTFLDQTSTATNLYNSKLLSIKIIEGYGDLNDLNMLAQKLDNPKELTAIRVNTIESLVNMANRLNIEADDKTKLTAKFREVIKQEGTSDETKLACYQAIDALNGVDNK